MAKKQSYSMVEEVHAFKRLLKKMSEEQLEDEKKNLLVELNNHARYWAELLGTCFEREDKFVKEQKLCAVYEEKTARIQERIAIKMGA